MHIHEENESKVLDVLEKICLPVLYPLHYLLPIEKFPEIAFLLIMILYFVATDFILTVVSVISVYTQLSHIIIGITLISWG
jgi:uncharacterized protein YggT (Ycf19 family)